MRDIKSTFGFLFISGTIILLFGFILIWIPESTISGLKEQLSQAVLNNEKASLQRIISAENLNLITFYQPIASIIKVVGGIVISYSILFTCFNVWMQNKNKVNSDLPEEIEEREEIEEKPLVEMATLDTFVLENEVEPEKPLGTPYLNSSLEVEFEKSRSQSSVRPQKPSSLWYLVPFLFGILGGIVGYLGTKQDDPELADGLLIFGAIMSIVFVIGYLIIMSSAF
jgi:hypothetical protein